MCGKGGGEGHFNPPPPFCQADGYIARTFPEQASSFGTVLDPLADKLLICFLFLALTSTGHMPCETCLLSPSSTHCTSLPPRYMQCYSQVWFWAGTSSWFWGGSTSASPLCLPRWVLVGVSQLLAHRCTCPSAYPLQRTWAKYWDIQRSTLQMTPTPISKVPGKQQQHEHLQSAHPLPLASLLPHR